MGACWQRLLAGGSSLDRTESGQSNEVVVHCQTLDEVGSGESQCCETSWLQVRSSRARAAQELAAQRLQVKTGWPPE
jgi:hypothetical protein